VGRIPCRDHSVDAVYSAYMIEHLDRSEAQQFLRETRRILRPGGIVRLAAPDISLQIQDYLDGHDADASISGTELPRFDGQG
jgi:predicted SAM-dependent methyltransferase